MFNDLVAVRTPRRSDALDGAVVDPATLRKRLLGTKGVDEAVVVKTCQRLEIYAYGPGADRAVPAVVDDAEWPADVRTRLIGTDVVEHLFRVAAGLESIVLGEDEILGQLRRARIDALEDGTLDGTLERVVSKALRVGERSRSETDLGRGTVSIGTVAVQRAADAYGDLGDATVVVLGAGEVASLVVRALGRRAESPAVAVVNRSPDRAHTMAAAVDGTVHPLDELETLLADADVLVTATGAPEPLLERDDITDHELVVVDLATPPDVAPGAATVSGITLLDLDDLDTSSPEGVEKRTAAIPAVERIIEEERVRLRREIRAESVDAAIGEIHRRAERIKRSETRRAIARLNRIEGLSAAGETAIEEFASSLTATLLHQPTSTLREAAADGDVQTVEALLRAFDDLGTQNRRERDAGDERERDAGDERVRDAGDERERDDGDERVRNAGDDGSDGRNPPIVERPSEVR